jgi:hypothetical protein
MLLANNANHWSWQRIFRSDQIQNPYVEENKYLSYAGDGALSTRPQY